jgi:hypothetical protein
MASISALHAFHGHGVVDAGALPPTPVALYIDQALRRGELDESGVPVLVAGNEGDVITERNSFCAVP